MNNHTAYERHRQLREAAIVIASLDEDCADRLLEGMSLQDAADIREAVERLGHVDPEEQHEIGEKFRRSTAMEPPTKVDGVELDASLLAAIERHDRGETPSSPQPASGPLETLTDAEASSIVKMLSVEHPQTIAIVLSRIDASKAASLLAQLSTRAQTDVLARLANLDSADEATVQVVESQLAAWIDQQRQKKQRITAGKDLVQRILAFRPDAERQALLSNLGGQVPAFAEPSGQEVKPKTPSTTPVKQNYARARATRIHKFDLESRLARQTTPAPPIEPEPSPAPQSIDACTTNEPRAPIGSPDLASETSAAGFIGCAVINRNPLLELDQMDDATLKAALSQTDRQVSAMALVGSSDALMKRVLRGLPRRQAKLLQGQLRTIGPTRLSDMLAAQQELVNNARRLAAA
jgi:flagellar motor switch protein FliG